ncbi:MAG TPA: sugar phosphate isomerase/epimerase, partial [Patescibacteria group bacterium]|nr:sugar phosphate isomerase/epimerase [Patescibacteria group bacterium]
MSWVVHSTVPYPMLKEPDTPRMLADAGVGPEIYLSGGALDAITPAEAESVARMLRDAGIRSL